MTAGYQLEFGDLALMCNDWTGDFRIDTLGVNASFGNAAPVADVVSSLMVDGDLTTTTRYGNRTATFDVTITAPDTAALADGEAALTALLDRPSTLTWRVPYGAATVFDVMRSWPEHQFDDLTEVLQKKRTYRLSFECLPFGRSEDAVSFTWTGPGVELDPLTSAAGWTVVSGSAPTIVSDSDEGTTSMLRFPTGGATIEQTFTAPLQEYLWLKTTASFIAGESVSVNGTDVPTSAWGVLANSGGRYIAAIPTGDAAGSVGTVRIVGATGRDIMELYTVGYPGKPVDGLATKPNGIGLIDVAGSARTACTISFTAPAGGAFVYTAPDPNVAIRERGAGEVLFAHFLVTAADGAEVSVGSQLMWFPPGTHSAQIGATSPQPLELHPDGVWPTQFSGAWAPGTGITGGFKYAYPADSKAAITFYDTTGAKNIVSPSPSLPEGYHGGAVHHEVHALHPGRCGFAVLNSSGNPISTTVTYYPRWWSHAAQ